MIYVRHDEKKFNSCFNDQVLTNFNFKRGLQIEIALKSKKRSLHYKTSNYAGKNCKKIPYGLLMETFLHNTLSQFDDVS